MAQPMPGSDPMTDSGAMPTPPDQAAQEGTAIGEMQQATPEEQAQYDHFVAKAYDLIYDQKTLPKIVDMLDGDGQDPMEGLARATALIVGRIGDAAEKAGEHLSGDVVLHAGTEIFEDLANLSRVANIKDYSQDRDALEGAYFRALDIFRGMLQEAGALDQGAAAADMDRLTQMDADGQLEAVFQSLAERDAAEAPDEGQPAEQAAPAPQEMENA